MVTEVSETVGFIGVLMSIIFFGSFGIFLKAPICESLSPHPIEYQIYYCVAVAIVGIPFAFIGGDITFSIYPLIGACLWVPSSLLALFAIRNAGLGPGQGVWSGVTIIVSVMWGVFYYDEEIKSPSLFIIALIAMLAALVVAAFAGAPVEEDDDGTEMEIRSSFAENKKKPSFAKGMIASVGLGLLNGSLMAPLKASNMDAFVYTFEFSSYSLLVILVIYLIMHKRIALNTKFIFKYGVLSGLFWALGNFGSIIASISPLGMSVGFPLTQAALVIGGLWAIYYFKEITQKKKIAIFLLASLTVVGTAYLFSIAKA
ncbi:hypothetical protein PCE1_001776 [Barthelona sp. PCE]